MRILVTGMSATGKSTLVAHLRRRGLRALDADDDGFSVPREDGRWGWDAARVAMLLRSVGDEPLVFAGCSEEQRDLPFDLRILLVCPEDVLVQRLRTRTTNAYGSTDEQRAQILADRDAVEPLLRASADAVLDTGTLDVAAVADGVLRAAARHAPLGVCADDLDEALALDGVADFAELSGRDLVAAPDLGPWHAVADALPRGLVCNRLLPYGITLHDDPEALPRLAQHWTALLERGSALGVRAYSLGGAAARAVPDAPGPERDATTAGIRRVVALLAQRTLEAGATLYLEPLRPAECGWLHRAADGASFGADGVLGLCSDVVHLAEEAAGDGWPAATAWARGQHVHLSGPDHGPLTGHEDAAVGFVDAASRGPVVERIALEVFEADPAQRREQVAALRDARQAPW